MGPIVTGVYRESTPSLVAKSFVESSLIRLLFVLWYITLHQANSAFHPLRVGKYVAIHGLRGWRPLNGVWLFVVGQSPVAAGLAYGL